MGENIILNYNSYADVGVLSDGDWQITLDNLKLRNLRRVARSTDLDPENTLFRVAMAGPATIKVFALGPSNMTPGGSYRISADGVDLTGFVSGAAQVEWNTLTWEEQEFWSGIPAWEDSERGPWIIHVFDAPVTGTNWLVEIDDQSNPDGYVQFGRLFMGRFWQPSVNYGYSGNGLSFRNESFRSESLGNTKKFWRRVNPRVFRFSLEGIEDSEMFGAGYDLQRIVGYDGEIFVVPDADDVVNLQKRSFLATAETMDALSQAVLGFSTTAFELEEVT